MFIQIMFTVFCTITSLYRVSSSYSTVIAPQSNLHTSIVDKYLVLNLVSTTSTSAQQVYYLMFAACSTTSHSQIRWTVFYTMTSLYRVIVVVYTRYI
jgi:hypothetical protein